MITILDELHIQSKRIDIKYSSRKLYLNVYELNIGIKKKYEEVTVQDYEETESAIRIKFCDKEGDEIAITIDMLYMRVVLVKCSVVDIELIQPVVTIRKTIA